MNQSEAYCYCQNCRAANRLGDHLCLRCGTPLMLLVEPAALRFEQCEPVTLQEEDLFERVSALEMRVNRTLEKVQGSLQKLLQQTHSCRKDSAALSSLIDSLSSLGILAGQAHTLGAKPVQFNRNTVLRFPPISSRAALRRNLLATSVNQDSTSVVARLIEQSFVNMDAGRAAQGQRLLERATQLDPANLCLRLLLAQQYLQQRRFARALGHLVYVAERAQTDWRVRIAASFAALARGDVGLAEHLLGDSRPNRRSFAQRVVDGLISAARRDWKSAADNFHAAFLLNRNEVVGYLEACANILCGKFSAGEAKLLKIILKHESFVEARFVMGLLHGHAGRLTEAKIEFAFVARLAPEILNLRTRSVGAYKGAPLLERDLPWLKRMAGTRIPAPNSLLDRTTELILTDLALSAPWRAR